MRKNKKSHYALLELPAGSRTCRAAVRVEPKLPTGSGVDRAPLASDCGYRRREAHGYELPRDTLPAVCAG